MESVFAYYDGEKFIVEKKIALKKGQKIMLTLLEDDARITDEAAIMYNTAIKNESFEYLFAEGEVEYTIDDCKQKLR